MAAPDEGPIYDSKRTKPWFLDFTGVFLHLNCIFMETKEFIVDVIALSLLPFYVKKFINCLFSGQYMESWICRESDLRPIWLPSLFFHFLLLQYGWDPAYIYVFTSLEYSTI